MEIGIDSFAARFDDAGLAASPVDRMRELLERIEQADQVGLDVFGVGEHHKREFLDSAPPVILAAAAGRTRRIRLTSAVAVLSAAEPVRLFQQFATLDLLSEGRAEMVVGRDHRRRPAAVSAPGGSLSRGGSTRRTSVRAIARRRARARVRGAEYETGCRRICSWLH